MNLFDILGPVMVGPSSSHTAGAVQIGRMARRLLGEEVLEADISLHGSFLTTGYGHGTDKALIAGLMNFLPDDARIADSFEYAKKSGMSFSFHGIDLKEAHPNTALLSLKGKNGGTCRIQGCSLGGGRILIEEINGIPLSFRAEKPTLLVAHRDVPGALASIASLLYDCHSNIATLQLFRDSKGGNAFTVAETDAPLPESLREELLKKDAVSKVYIFTPEDSAYVSTLSS